MILIVEDNGDLCELLAEVLRLDGLEVTPATTSEAALAIARAQPLHLIILDFNIGGAGSDAFVDALRSDDGLARIPLLLVSGSSDIDELAARLKVQGYLRKPIDPDTLLSSVHRFALA